MKRFFATFLGLTACFSAIFDVSAAPLKKLATLTVSSSSIVDFPANSSEKRPIAEKFAYCAPDGAGKTKKAPNVSPQLSWIGAPKGTKSFAIVVVDPDVPAKFDDANQEGKTIAEDFARQNFYHWLLVDIPADVFAIPEGEGKKFKNGIALINDFAGGKNLPEFMGYDGPCPPWNDVRLHHYHFIVYALDIANLDIKSNLASREAIAKIEQHALAKGEIVGTYSNYKQKLETN
jgi:Raf kinase inhibitor-like YbhB/YbcL family protein